jgi:hypothetical protein
VRGVGYVIDTVSVQKVTVNAKRLVPPEAPNAGTANYHRPAAAYPAVVSIFNLHSVGGPAQPSHPYGQSYLRNLFTLVERMDEHPQDRTAVLEAFSKALREG